MYANPKLIYGRKLHQERTVYFTHYRKNSLIKPSSCTVQSDEEES